MAFLGRSSEEVMLMLRLLPGQVLQQRLQLLADQFDQTAFHVAVGDVDHEDVGWRVRGLVVLEAEARMKPAVLRLNARGCCGGCWRETGGCFCTSAAF